MIWEPLKGCVYHYNTIKNSNMNNSLQCKWTPFLFAELPVNMCFCGKYGFYWTRNKQQRTCWLIMVLFKLMVSMTKQILQIYIQERIGNRRNGQFCSNNWFNSFILWHKQTYRIQANERFCYGSSNSIISFFVSHLMPWINECEKSNLFSFNNNRQFNLSFYCTMNSMNKESYA